MNGHEKSCSEWQEWTRRQFLKRGASVAAGAAAATSMLPRMALGAGGAGADRDVLVYILLRGGMDALTAVAPYGDGDLYAARPTLAIRPPGQPDGATDLDGFFGLAPASAGFLPAFQNGHLAVVHAAGSPDPTRSHFEAFRKLEYGIPNQPLHAAFDGWLARHLASVAPVASGDFRGAALVDMLPKTFVGAPGGLPIPDLANFAFPGSPATADLRKQLIQDMYGPAPEPMASAAVSSLATMGILDAIDFEGYVPAGGAEYPDSTFGHGLRQSAALVKADVGIEALMLETAGWDLHNALGPLDGDLATMLKDLTDSVMAFYADMAAHLDKVTVVIMSEFGRRVAENSSLGLDHGHGNAILLLGGNVNGGQVITQWPGLAPQDLDQGDLQVTIDYRDVLGEILEKRMGSTDLGYVFPNHTPTFHGVV